VDIAVFDRLTASVDWHGASFFTVNHPTRLTLRHVSEAVHQEIGLPFDDLETDELLGWIETPVENPVASVLGLPQNGVPGWVIDGQPVPTETVFRAQLDFYLQRPDVVGAAMEKHAVRLAQLRLAQTS
jgi:hypothetical protein